MMSIFCPPTLSRSCTLGHYLFMNIYVLTETPNAPNFVGWSMVHCLQDVFATTCNAQFIFPQRAGTNLLFSYGCEEGEVNLLGKAWRRLSKSWYSLEQLPTLNDGPNILLVLGFTPSTLMALYALRQTIHQFDLRIGYLLDGFKPTDLSSRSLSLIDHLYVISADLAEKVQDLFSVKTSVLPLGVDTTLFEPLRGDRGIDIIGYGRINQQVHKTLQKHFNGSDCEQIYFHSTFDALDVFDVREHISLYSKMLSRSKVSLCFEASDLARFSGTSPLLYRWFEGWAAGCAIVGRKPFGKEVSELLDWPDSTIEIPESSDEWIPFFEALLADQRRLSEISKRNYIECRLRHDWRYRIRDLFQQQNIPLPETLTLQIQQLQSTYQLALAAKKVYPILEGDRDVQFPTNLEVPLRATA